MTGRFEDWLRKLGHTPGLSDVSSHKSGTLKGEEAAKRLGKEPGRDNPRGERTPRDSTSINPEGEEVIDPRMRPIPPA